MLPAEFYTSLEVFTREREQVFRRHWLYAGHVSELPEAGSYFLFELDGESVVVVRDGEGTVRAFHNVCRHRGSALCREAAGRVPGKIQCAYHAWTYGLDGALLAAPNMHDVADFRLEDWPLRAVAVEVCEGFVFASFAEVPEPFAAAHAPLLGRFARWHLPELASAHRTCYEVEANWKLLFQNYSECYHCPVAHPLLNRLTPYRAAWNDLDEGPILGGPMKMSREGGSMTMDGRRCAPPLGEVGGEDLNLVHYYTIFPNLFLSLHPDYVLVHRLEPLGPARTRIRCDWFFDRRRVGTPEIDPARAVEFWDLTNRQDWDLVTGAQRGVASSGYVPGPYAELESQLAAFDRHYLRVLGEEPTLARERRAR
jgi:Rieske 2Fe-2S family protein